MTKIPENEALRYFGLRDGADAGALALLRSVIAEYEKSVEPRLVMLELPCASGGGGLSIGGAFFKSADLEKHLAGCESALLFAATLGAKADMLARSFSVRSAAAGAAAQAAGAAMVERFCDDECEKLEEKYSASGLHITPRFSPGYGDLSINSQTDFFRLLDVTRKIGVALTDTLMMTPSKSVTAFIGITKSPAHSFSKCLGCGNKTCPFRRETQ
jgi:hypothetical protein